MEDILSEHLCFNVINLIMELAFDYNNKLLNTFDWFKLGYYEKCFF